MMFGWVGITALYLLDLFVAFVTGAGWLVAKAPVFKNGMIPGYYDLMALAYYCVMSSYP